MVAAILKMLAVHKVHVFLLRLNLVSVSITCV